MQGRHPDCCADGPRPPGSGGKASTSCTSCGTQGTQRQVKCPGSHTTDRGDAAAGQARDSGDSTYPPTSQLWPRGHASGSPPQSPQQGPPVSAPSALLRSLRKTLVHIWQQHLWLPPRKPGSRGQLGCVGTYKRTAANEVPVPNWLSHQGSGYTGNGQKRPLPGAPRAVSADCSAAAPRWGSRGRTLAETFPSAALTGRPQPP